MRDERENAKRRKDKTMTTNANKTTNDPGHDLVIAKTTRRDSGAGTWVRGTCNGYRFDALVFPEHAEQAEWEIGTSRISKLWIKRLADGRMVYNWDRGLDVPPADADTQAMVEFLCEGLAEYVYGD